MIAADENLEAVTPDRRAITGGSKIATANASNAAVDGIDVSLGDAPSLKAVAAASGPVSNTEQAKRNQFVPSLKPTAKALVQTASTASAPANDKVAATTKTGFYPSLKPTGQNKDKNDGRLAAVTPKSISFGGFAIPDERNDPPPIFFASDMVADRTPPAPIAIALNGDVPNDPSTVVVKLSKGENFVDVLKKAGIRAADRNAAAAAFGKVQDLRKLRPGQEFELTIARANQTLFQLVSNHRGEEKHLLGLNFRADPKNNIGLNRIGTNNFTATKKEIPITTRLASIQGRIDGSLFVSAKEAGAPNQVIADLANMFAYDIDFQRDIFGGDEFEAIFELEYDNEGRVVGTGDILYGRLNWRGRKKEKGYYQFATANGGKKADFFDRAGQSAKRLLMKTPIDGARLSSGFGTRKHPILGYRKAHKGVDFAARRGTPIYAAGDGVVERANRFGSFGNYIKIRHANGYKTAYAHLNGFRRGIKAGKRVEQGDVIGYVGTTGRSTGPHLHYEVHYKGRQINPQKLKIATGVQLKGSELDRFKVVRDQIDAMRTPAKAQSALFAKENDTADTAL